MKESNNKKQYGYVFFTGAAMGAADIVPGVSGGTMAFIFGVYEELIFTIKSFNWAWIRLLFRGRFKEALEHINWKFLLALGSGLLIAILSLTHILSWLLVNQSVRIYAFFLGLIVASIIALTSHVHWTPRLLMALCIGSLGAYLVVGMVPIDMPHDPLTLFLSGSVAICAMILPGISGSFILLILGQYEFIINAVKDLDIITLIPAVGGMVAGILVFSRILSWLLKHYHQITVTLLIGFMVGSLRRIWPYKEVTSVRINRHGEEVPSVFSNVLPDFGSIDFIWALGLCIGGFVLISLLEHIQSRSNPFICLFTRSNYGKDGT